MTRELTADDRKVLLTLARRSIQHRLQQERRLEIALEDYSLPLQEPGACFVTLTRGGMLRGCVGSIEATQPLVLDVRDRALGAAFHDYRFPPLTEAELPATRIEISRLTIPEDLEYRSPQDLVAKLRPGLDGLILSYQTRRATFLPQVWEQLPQPEDFLDRLCLKMGLEGSAWRKVRLEAATYQAEKFEEADQGS